ncbi:hypothetical protein GI374_05070 [Paracoccus sp. S-4012]|uniref:BrnA antitoxin family protein n=1 Tax=Paracoccus sp. S-4012 TaxID=2665648 RepID=UPI0012B03AAE|nr:BrnA antitoxin family protein [Paracoccus sp. S-4012]MRX49834.1 hypothetical protein [Paracoccus sp. S-4012]
MSGKISGPYTMDEILQMEDKTDWERLRREEAEGPYEGEEDEEIAGIEWGEAVLVIPEPKQAVSLRIDRDVIDFFKSQGKGYQTRMNAVLRAYMEAKKAG